METERSIVLQKKMILFLSLAIIGMFSALYMFKEKKDTKNVYMAKLENLDIITVKAPDDENKVLRKSVKFYAVRTMSEDTKDENTQTELSKDLSLSEEKIVYKEDIVPNDEEFLQNVEQNIAPSEVNMNQNEATAKQDIVITEQNGTDSNQNVATTEVKTEEKKLVRYRDLAEDNPPEEYIKTIEVSATAYCLCKKCCGKTPDNPSYGNTHSGLKIVPGSGIKVIAVDPNVIPLNSKVYVEGLNGAWDYGHAIAADTGGAIKEAKIDLYMDTHKEALEWGRRKVKVYILGE